MLKLAGKMDEEDLTVKFWNGDMAWSLTVQPADPETIGQYKIERKDKGRALQRA